MNDPILFVGIGLIGLSVFLIVRLVLTRGSGGSRPGEPEGPKLSRAERKAEQKREQAAGGIFDARDLMVEKTTRLVENRNGRALQDRLEQSGSQLRSGEWVLLTLAIALVLGALGYLLGGIVAFVLLAGATPIVANTMLNRNVTKRQEAFADQLPDLLQNLSSSLRSGQSLPQSIASMAPDLEAPAGDELRRVVIENRIGRDLIESFNDLANRMNSVDFDWVVRAIEINYRTGGDLSVILRRLDSTIRARNHVAGTVRALSAEGRISGIVLAALPPVMMLAVQIINPDFLIPMFTTSIGWAMLIFAGVQLLVGTIWLNRMARFKF
ncbi:MAG: type II secretion system F family protein [Actinomycetota bacterium]